MTDEEDAGALRAARAFKYAAMGALLVITVASALLPLYVARHGTAQSQGLLSRKLPFATAGVFLGSGLLHLLPDAVKLYGKLLLSMEDPARWMERFPLMYFLCAVGCAIVWAIDLLNMGNSGKMMAVASAARPDCTCPHAASATCEPPTDHSFVPTQTKPACTACRSRRSRASARATGPCPRTASGASRPAPAGTSSRPRSSTRRPRAPRRAPTCSPRTASRCACVAACAAYAKNARSD